MGIRDEFRLSEILTYLSERDPNYYRYERSTDLFNNPKKMEDKHLDAYEEKYGTLPRWNNNDTR